MITREETGLAIAGSRKALQENESLKWVRSSALLERAYFLGLWSGLKMIADENDLDGLISTTVAQTICRRSADDTFGGTRLGAAYAEFSDRTRRRLEDTLCKNEYESAYKAACVTKKDFDELISQVKELRGYLNQTVEKIYGLIEGLERSGNRKAKVDEGTIREQLRLIDELERFLRIVALLETDHLLETRVMG